MNKLKILSIGACVALCMVFASCENDEPYDCEQIKGESGILIEQEVDLGLPSGTIWASWNVGASTPEQFGGYYAWGEIEEKTITHGIHINIGSMRMVMDIMTGVMMNWFLLVKI